MKYNIRQSSSWVVCKHACEMRGGAIDWGSRFNYADSAAVDAVAAVRRASIAFASSTRTGGTCAACHRYLSPPRIGSYSPSVTRLPVKCHTGHQSGVSKKEREREQKRRTFPVQDSVRAPSDVTRLGDCQPHFLNIPVARRLFLRVDG